MLNLILKESIFYGSTRSTLVQTLNRMHVRKYKYKSTSIGKACIRDIIVKNP